MKFQYSFFYVLILIVNPDLHSQALNYSDVLINEVYDNINDAIGDISHEAPSLVLSDSKRTVARYIPSINTIEFEYAAYDVCRKLGSDSLNAVAFILAHELAHYYRDHSWLSNAGTAYVSSDLGQKLQDLEVSIDTTIRYEAEADEFSFYYSKIAGYSIKAASQLYDSLYFSYSLNHNIPRYPSLNDRKQISLHVQEKALELNKLFDLASVLIIKREYKCASILYRHILNSEFGSREIFNNLGVIYAFEGLKHANDELVKIDYPFSIELTSRLSEESQRGLFRQDTLKSQAFFKKAKEMFEKANNLDLSYLPSQINSVIISALLNDFRYANYVLEGLKDTLLEKELLIRLRKCVDEVYSFYHNGESFQSQLSPLELTNDSSIFDSLFSFKLPEIPAIPINRQQLGKGKTLRFQNGEGSVRLFQKDSLGWEINLIDFRGSGGFSRNFRFAILNELEAQIEKPISNINNQNFLELGKKKIFKVDNNINSLFYIVDDRKVETVFIEYY